MTTAVSLQLNPPHVNVHLSASLPHAGSDCLAMLALDDTGVIQNCSQACEQMFGYRQHDLTGCHVALLLPQLGETELVQEGRINARLAYLSHCAIAFQARHRDGRHFASELFINRLDSHRVVVLVRSLDGAATRVGDMVARPVR